MDVSKDNVSSLDSQITNSSEEFGKAMGYVTASINSVNQVDYIEEEYQKENYKTIYKKVFAGKAPLGHAYNKWLSVRRRFPQSVSNESERLQFMKNTVVMTNKLRNSVKSCIEED